MNKLLTIFGLALAVWVISNASLSGSSLALLASAGGAVADTADTAEMSVEVSPGSERCAERRAVAESADASGTLSRGSTAPRIRPTRGGGSWQSLLPGSIR